MWGWSRGAGSKTKGGESINLGILTFNDLLYQRIKNLQK
jgi:hypothetical protein